MPFLTPKSLPKALWEGHRLHIPPVLHTVYVKALSDRNWLDDAKTPSQSKKIYGGASDEETKEHFTKRFYGSVVRLQNVLLDPQGKFEHISKNLLLTFSSHSVAVLDVPCGTGAGGLTLVSLAHELRLAGMIPKLPIAFNILAGDISEGARSIYQEQMERLRPEVRRTGIDVRLATEHWDALDLESTNSLCYSWEKTALQSMEGFVLVTNFSGAGSEKFAKLEESFRHMAVRVSHRNATLLWVEPGGEGGIEFLGKVFKSIGRFFGLKDEAAEETPYSEANWWHKLQEKQFDVKSCVHKYKRPE